MTPTRRFGPATRSPRIRRRGTALATAVVLLAVGLLGPGTVNATGVSGSIDVEKLVSIDGGATFVDADTVTGPILLESGADPIFKFVVTNTGNVTLSNVTLSDSDFDLNGPPRARPSRLVALLRVRPSRRPSPRRGSPVSTRTLREHPARSPTARAVPSLRPTRTTPTTSGRPRRSTSRSWSASTAAPTSSTPRRPPERCSSRAALTRSSSSL
jgi:hypothetical protein